MRSRIQRPCKVAAGIRDWLVAHLAHRLQCEAAEIDVRQPFARYGLTSRDALEIAAELEQRMKRPLSPSLVYDYPSIDSLSQHLAENASLLAEPSRGGCGAVGGHDEGAGVGAHAIWQGAHLLAETPGIDRKNRGSEGRRAHTGTRRFVGTSHSNAEFRP